MKYDMYELWLLNEQNRPKHFEIITKDFFQFSSYDENLSNSQPIFKIDFSFNE